MMERGNHEMSLGMAITLDEARGDRQTLTGMITMGIPCW